MSRYPRVRLNRWQVGTSGSSRPMLLKRALPPTITYKLLKHFASTCDCWAVVFPGRALRRCLRAQRRIAPLPARNTCEGQALISKEEQDEVLAVPGLRP